MPYSYPSNIPATVKNLPSGVQKLFIRVFNSVYNKTKDENKSRMAAWSIVKGKYKKVGNKWVRKENLSISKGDKKMNLKSTKERLAEWTRKYINTLPDSSFAIILPGGKKDRGGKTVPRGLRKLPYKDSSGKIDLAHLKNALARVAQGKTKLSPAQRSKARRKLLAAARRVGVGKHSRTRLAREIKMKANELKEKLSEDSEEAPKEEVKEEPKPEEKKEEATDSEKPEEEKKSEESSEEKPKEEVEEPKKEEEVPAEKSSEEAPAEEKKEEPVEKEKKEEEKEEKLLDSGKEDVEKLEAEEKAEEERLGLEIVTTVKKELVKEYTENVELLSKNEKLLEENKKLKENFEKLSLKVKEFEATETKRLEDIKKEKLSKLSNKFKELGKERSVEQLSKYNEEDLKLFESITDSALKKISAEKLNKSTIPSAAVSTKETKKVIEKVNKESLGGGDFFEKLCNFMAKKEQSRAQ